MNSSQTYSIVFSRPIRTSSLARGLQEISRVVLSRAALAAAFIAVFWDARVEAATPDAVAGLAKYVSTNRVAAPTNYVSEPAGSPFRYRIVAKNGGTDATRKFFDLRPLPPGLTLNTNLGGSGYVTVLPGQNTVQGTYPVTLFSGYWDTNDVITVATADATIDITAPMVSPAITAQPASLSLVLGDPASFLVQAVGTAPLSYQWFFNDQPVVGEADPLLQIAAVSASNVGSYTVVVSNGSGSVTSAPASIVLLSAPLITQQPTNLTAVVGTTASFQVAAGGSAPLKYQWYFGATALAARTNATLSLTSVAATNAGSYSVVVGNSVGSVTSSVARLTVVTRPAITTQPASLTVTVGSSATFSVAATGTAPLRYQWRKAAVAIAGATNTTYRISTAALSDAGSYSVIVSNAYGSVTSTAATLTVNPAAATLLAWSDLGFHETLGNDFSVFSVAPLGNTIQAQLVVGGKLVTSATGYTVTYEAVADASGSINTTSVGKGNFYDHVLASYGKDLAPDQGLDGYGMPGKTNKPQPMGYDTAQRSFVAKRIPVTPYDDKGKKNRYPTMKVVARDSTGTIIASTTVALPITDEMSCITCHASGSPVAARPTKGWVWDCDPDRDYKLNILWNHDDHHLGAPIYSNVLAAVGYNQAGLVATVLQDGKAVTCVKCHTSNIQPGSGAPEMRPFTALIHTKHSYSLDEATGQPIDTLAGSESCLRCHAGPENMRIRGAHHALAGADGSPAMSCVSCHGRMADVGMVNRAGWVDEPQCQSCHTGTATSNNGSIRYTSVFTPTNTVRKAVNLTFASQANTPSNGLSLFRLSHGHGNLNCATCHGSAHAEGPSLVASENIQSKALQVQSGVVAKCSACHPTTPTGTTGGPHGMHPVGQTWVSAHDNAGRSGCTSCHGSDSRGTVLSQSGFDQTLSGKGTHNFWQGNQIGCYTCHNGPNSDNTNPNTPAVVQNVTGSTVSDTPIKLTLAGSDANGNALTYHIVRAPANGRVVVSGKTATYVPHAGFRGADSFTYAAFDTQADSNVGTASVTVTPGTCSLTAKALVPTAALPDSAVSFHSTASLDACDGAITYDWDFGDGSAHAQTAEVCHTYTTPQVYTWTLVVTANGQSQTISGSIDISTTLGPPVIITITDWGWAENLSWIPDNIPCSLETSYDLSDPNGWIIVLDPPQFDGYSNNVMAFVLPGQQFFRLRRVP